MCCMYNITKLAKTLTRKQLVLNFLTIIKDIDKERVNSESSNFSKERQGCNQLCLG